VPTCCTNPQQPNHCVEQLGQVKVAPAQFNTVSFARCGFVQRVGNTVVTVQATPAPGALWDVQPALIDCDAVPAMLSYQHGLLLYILAINR
jgi:hypothetical protein